MADKVRLYQVDAFTTQIFTGNSAGVVPNASGLTDSLMQSIAREMNNSETAFLFPPTTPDHDVHVRFFTPTTEVPICGHATIAAHYVRALELGFRNGTVRQKTGAGLLTVEISGEGDDPEIIMTQGKPEFSEAFSPLLQHQLCDSLGITPRDLDERCPIQIVSTGHSKVLVGLRSLGTLKSLRPDVAALTALSAEISCNGFYAFVINPIEPNGLVQGRMFAPAIGINEDPATGNANGPLGAYIVRHRLAFHDGKELEFVALQGSSMGRPGKIRVMVTIDHDEPTQVRVAGRAVIVFRTELALGGLHKLEASG